MWDIQKLLRYKDIYKKLFTNKSFTALFIKHQKNAI